MNETTDAAAIFAPIWRRKWLILIVGVLVGVGTYLYYRHEPDVFAARTQLYFGSAAEQSGVLNSTLGRTSLSTTQIADQAALINSTIGEVVRRQLREKHDRADRAELRGKVHAKSSSGSDFIDISAEAHSPAAAAALANAYAAAYIKRHEEGYQRAIRAAIAVARRQLIRVEADEQAPAGAPKGKGSSSSRNNGLAGLAALQAATLSAKVSQLESDLTVSSVQQVTPATPRTAQLVSPTPKRNAIFGFVIGLVLAAIAVYATNRFERRLRSLGDVEAAFQTQILAVLPRVKTPVVLAEGGPRPADPLLEPLRGLHTSLQLGDMLEHDKRSPPRLILFLSADTDDGKSTLVADLALVQRDAGARVAVIEADLRRPVLANLLSVSAPRGLAEVLAGAVTFEGAMQDVGLLGSDLQAESARAVAGVSTVAQARHTGSLSLLAGGAEAANPPALLASAAMGELLRSAAADFDQVLIDAPSLQVSDAMPLLRAVDGIVIVARMGHTREASAERLTQLLSRSATAPVLGVVANAVSRAESRRHGFSSAYGGRRPAQAS